MKMLKRVLLASFVLAAVGMSAAVNRVFGDCGPFSDVTFFCAPILELYDVGIANGTSATTFGPSQTASRGEIAALLTRSFNQTVKRTSPRAALGHWWTPKNFPAMGFTAFASAPQAVASDGTDVWVTTEDGGVSRVRGGDGKIIDQWTGEAIGASVLVAMGRVFVVGGGTGKLYGLDPKEPSGALSVFASTASGLGTSALGLAFDGSRIWTQNDGNSVSIVTPGASLPWSATTVSLNVQSLAGILYDGANVWVTDSAGGNLVKLDANGAIAKTVGVGAGAAFPMFDGANIWVPNESSDSISVVRASTGAVVGTLTGNGLATPAQAAFDGEHVLVTNLGGSVSLWRAADLAPLGTFATVATQPFGICSDGLNFWIALRGPAPALARF